MIKKIAEYIFKKIEDRVNDLCVNIKNSIEITKPKEYSLDREMERIHDLPFTQDERTTLQQLQKNTSHRTVLEKCCFTLSVKCRYAQTLDQLYQQQAGIKALEFLLGEMKKSDTPVKRHPLTGLPLPTPPIK